MNDGVSSMRLKSKFRSPFASLRPSAVAVARSSYMRRQVLRDQKQFQKQRTPN